jgi:hypothetical protein
VAAEPATARLKRWPGESPNQSSYGEGGLGERPPARAEELRPPTCREEIAPPPCQRPPPTGATKNKVSCLRPPVQFCHYHSHEFLAAGQAAHLSCRGVSSEKPIGEKVTGLICICMHPCFFLDGRLFPVRFNRVSTGEKVLFVLFVLDSDFLNAYHVLVAMPNRKQPILFCSCMYMWCASVDVCMSVRICGFNLGFGCVDSQQAFLTKNAE